jgi:hypothetical protein
MASPAPWPRPSRISIINIGTAAGEQVSAEKVEVRAHILSRQQEENRGIERQIPVCVAFY